MIEGAGRGLGKGFMSLFLFMRLDWLCTVVEAATLQGYYGFGTYSLGSLGIFGLT